jgi:chromosome segregation ATPase
MSEDDSKKTNSFISGLKTEWALFWDSLIDDEDEVDRIQDKLDEDLRAERQARSFHSKDPFLTGKIESLSLEKIKVITRALSADRKKLNQKLESLNRELDLNSAKLDSLQLVGSDPSDTERRIHELSDLGQALNEELERINERLKIARTVEDQMKQDRTL